MELEGEGIRDGQLAIRYSNAGFRYCPLNNVCKLVMHEFKDIREDIPARHTPLLSVK
jgi:hypothetical protein